MRNLQRRAHTDHDAISGSDAAKPGGATLTEHLDPGPAAGPDLFAAPLQFASDASPSALSAASQDPHAIADAGVAGAGDAIPHADRIAESFGAEHAGTVYGIDARVGGAAADAAESMGARAYATGSRVGFAETPDLHTAAHEAAHVVQQGQGVHLKGGVGQEGDPYERHADAVADRVVRGESAADLLGARGAGAGVAVQHDKKKDKKAEVKIDDSKPGQALKHLVAADKLIDPLIKLSGDLSTKAMDKKASDEVVLALAQKVKPAADAVANEMKEVYPLLSKFIDEKAYGKTPTPVASVKAEALAQPGMGPTVDSITHKIAHFFADLKITGQYKPAARALLEDPRSTVWTSLLHTRALLDMPHRNYDELIGEVLIVVNAESIDLGSGSPRDRIQEACDSIADSYNDTITHFADGVERMVHTLDSSAFKKAESGLMDKVWEHAKGLIEKASEFISGTPFAATIGFAAIEKIMAFKAEMEAERKAGEKQAFIDKLHKKVNAMQLEKKEHYTGDEIQKLDLQFLATGDAKDPDHWNDKTRGRMVFGEQAKFLTDLKQKAIGYRAAAPTTDQYLSGFLISWINEHHKPVDSDMIRNPMKTGSTRMDGYFDIDMEIGYTGGGFYVVRPTSATLVCDKSAEVAQELMKAIDGFNLSEVPCAKQINITATSDAREHMYEMWGHDRVNTVRLDSSNMAEGAQWLHEYWQWVVKSSHASQRDLFYGIRTISG